MHNSVSIHDYFPLKWEPRPAQVDVLTFIERMVVDGVTDIVIEAPTGIGKSAIGSACCYWAADWPPQILPYGGAAQAGGYYLVTQKQLQTQIADEVLGTKTDPSVYTVRDFSSLWSSSDYTCDRFKKCQVGLRTKVALCSGRKHNCCPYLLERAKFGSSIFSLTNYPYFLTEREYVGKLSKRNILVLDECHTIERQLLKFGEVETSDKLLNDWGLRGISVPELDTMQQFAHWLDRIYLPKIKSQLEAYSDAAKFAGDDDDTVAKRITALDNQVRKVEACVRGVAAVPENWVYWCEQNELDGNIAYCKPLDASPYMSVLMSGAVVRVYMSAYPGEKEVFCRSIGLNPDEVAWKRLKSGFPKENRPVIMGLVGSMSRKCQSDTLPHLFRVVDKIVAKHHDEKGIIHCHSYDLGKKIMKHLSVTNPGRTVLFPQKSDERQEKYDQHRDPSRGPTVLLSPSMTEGFDFKYESARWQIIAKVPYPYLGDRQVAAKKDKSQEWYDQQTIMTIVQASGRVCRSEDDWGVTYVLDADFRQLWDRRRSMFPGWFKEALVWP